MRLCDLDEIKIQVKRQYEDCHGYTGNKKAIYREAILAVRSILHSAKTIDAVPVVRCRECKYHHDCGTHFCDALGMDCPDDSEFFCSYGKRKGGADNG